MANVVLFHHLLGVTDGVLAFADRLRAAGHQVHTPDLFAGARPTSIDEGFALTRRLGDEELEARADQALDGLPTDLVYAGWSFGAATAQRLAQTRPGCRGVLLYEGCLPISGEWAVGPWPAGLTAQIHGMEQDPFFAGEGDLDAARALVAAGVAELFLYPGDRHLFTDSSLPTADPAAIDLVVSRSLHLLAGLS